MSMANCIREIVYRCRDDCEMSGCPTHKGTIAFQSVSNAYTFNMDGRELSFEENELQAMIDLIKEIGRVDCIKI